jgi:arginyl-tRNA synthetase
VIVAKSHVYATIRAILDRTLRACKKAGLFEGDIPEYQLSRPRRPEHGDVSANVALVLGPRSGKAPRDLALAIRERIEDPDGVLASCDVAGPGFLNFRLGRDEWLRVLGAILEAGPAWGRGPPRARPRILLEYVSANPTGPLHVAHGRHAALGDSLARLLRFAGHPVTTEFYINDAGSKIDKFGASILARRRGEPPPPDGYQGDYVADLARELPDQEVGRAAAWGVERMLDDVRDVLGRFGVAFDVWQRERDLYDRGLVQRGLDELDERGWLDRREGAVWFCSTRAGDDKDRVVVRSTGEPTYFAADLAYHRDKYARGHDLLIDLWGADHHGAVARLRAGIAALGHPPGDLEVILMQFVNLLRNGARVAMDKSSGSYITLREVIDEVGRDAARFFLLMRRADSMLDFDLDLARRQSLDNPVYHVQYGCARAAAVLRRAGELGFAPPRFDLATARRLALDEEIALLRRMAAFPALVEEAAAAREPHRLCFYLMELSQDFQSYYTQLQKVRHDPILPQLRERVGDWRASWDAGKTAARLLWVAALRQVMENALNLIGVSAPERLTAPDRPAEQAEVEDA